MYLIPEPKKVVMENGVLKAGKIAADFGPFFSKQVENAYKMLCNDIKNTHEKTVLLTVRKSEKLTDCEEYFIVIEEKGIHIEASHAKGVFYALQTLRQIITTEEYFPCCTIYDKPDFAFRGLQNDTTRGRVPTLDGLKKTADICAYYKLNAIALYFEHSFAFSEFDGVVSPEEKLFPQELKEFVGYCENLYIDVIPYVAMFGHQYRLLQSDKYKHLCELEDYKPTLHYWQERMLHHSVDISNPESWSLIKSFIDQLTDVFPSELYIPGIDETFDLCKGKNKDKNMIEQYCSFTDKICAYLKEKGKRALIADDIIQKHDGGFFLKSENIIMYHWDYTKEPNEDQYKILRDKKLPFIAVPSTNSFNSVIENIDCSSKNIYNTAELAKKYGADGILNTIWGDRGHWCDFNCTLYGVVMGAAKSWNGETVFDEKFEADFSRLAFGEEEVNIPELLKKLEKLTANAHLYWLVRWYSENIMNGENTPFTMIEPKVKPMDNAQKAFQLCDYSKKLLEAHPDKAEQYESLAAAFGICGALNVLTDAIVSRKRLKAERICLVEEKLFEYRKSWLRDNKESEFYEIENFVRAIIEYLDKHSGGLLRR